MSEAPARMADVVVMGCGAAGLSAAIEAAERGARVVVLESEPQPAGSTRLSAGYAAFCETDLAPGPREALYEDLREAHHGDHGEALVRLYVEHAGGDVSSARRAWRPLCRNLPVRAHAPGLGP